MDVPVPLANPNSDGGISVSDGLGRIALRALRITVALIIAGVSLPVGFGPLVVYVEKYLGRGEVRWVRSDEAPLLERGFPEGTRVARALHVDIDDFDLRAWQTITISGNLELCQAIHRSVYRRGPEQISDPAAWVTGSFYADGRTLPYDSVVVSLDDADKARCTVSASSGTEKLFREEEWRAMPSDVLRFSFHGLGADEMRVRFSKNGVRVMSGALLPRVETPAVAEFSIPSKKTVRYDAVDFRVTRLARAATPKVRDVITRMDEKAARYVNPWFTAFLNAAPFVLLVVVMRKRNQAVAVVEMAEWLLALVILTHLTSAILSLNDWIGVEAVRVFKFLRYGPYGFVFVALACAVWPLMVKRWIRRGVPSSVASSERPRAWLPLLCIIALAGSLGSIALSGPAEVTNALAIAAFIGSCLWIVRELGGTVIDAMVAGAVAAALFLVAHRVETPVTYALAFLVLMAIVMVLVRGFSGSARMSASRFGAVFLACAAGSWLLIGNVEWGVYFELHSLLVSLGDVLTVAMLAAFVLVLRHLSLAGEPSTASLDVGFALGLMFIWRYRWGIYGMFVLGIGYLLLRYWLFAPRGPFSAAFTRVAVRDAICKVIALREAERALDALGRTMRKKVGEGTSKWSDYESATKELETLIAKESKDEAALDTSRLALAAGPSVSPWDRGARAALFGAVLALPWFLVFAADLFNNDVPSRGHWWLTLVASLLLAAIQWPLTGFFFGYFYPDIRGGNGWTKGLVYFATIVTPPLLGFLLFESDRLPESGIFAFWICQNFIQSVLVGLFAGDYRVLRDCGLSWRHLRDVHNLGVLTAYGSSVVVAIAGAISAAVASGAVSALGQFFGVFARK